MIHKVAWKKDGSKFTKCHLITTSCPHITLCGKIVPASPSSFFVHDRSKVLICKNCLKVFSPEG